MDPNIIDNAILARLRDYCPVFISVADDELWKHFVKIWGTLMALLCWNDKSCNSFLTGPRELMSDISINCCGTQEVDLQHYEIQSIDNVTIEIMTDEGIEIITINNPQNFWIEGTTVWNLFLTNNIVNQCIGKCDIAKLRIQYTAGYTDIPDCLYGAMCRILSQAFCDRNCIDQDCYSPDKLDVNAILSEKVVGDDEWRWEVKEDHIRTAVDKYRATGDFEAINQFSNCLNKITISSGAFC